MFTNIDEETKAEAAKIAYNCIKNIKLQAAHEILEIVEQCRVSDDGTREWRKHHNDCIDYVIGSIQKRFINKMEEE